MEWFGLVLVSCLLFVIFYILADWQRTRYRRDRIEHLQELDTARRKLLRIERHVKRQMKWTEEKSGATAEEHNVMMAVTFATIYAEAASEDKEA